MQSSLYYPPIHYGAARVRPIGTDPLDRIKPFLPIVAAVGFMGLIVVAATQAVRAPAGSQAQEPKSTRRSRTA